MYLFPLFPPDIFIPLLYDLVLVEPYEEKAIVVLVLRTQVHPPLKHRLLDYGRVTGGTATSTHNLMN